MNILLGKDRMNARVTTKKLPVPWSERTKKKMRGHMIPNVLGQDVATFVNLESLETERTGMLVYLGVEIGADEIEAKIRKKIPEFRLTADKRATLEAYLSELQRFRIGNVVEMLPDEEGKPSLLLLHEHALSEQSTRLP